MTSTLRHHEKHELDPRRRRTGRLAVAALATSAATALALAASAATAQPAAPDATSDPAASLQIATVSAATPVQKQRLLATGLDVLDIETPQAEVLLYGEADRRRLERGGWRFDVEPAAGELEELQGARAAEARAQAALADNPSKASSLPTGRVSYRDLDTVNAELHDLAEQHPEQVRLFEMPRTSLVGRPIYGVEIAGDVEAEDGDPVFLLTGVHHAREWPTLELTTEFATEAVTSYGTDPELTALMDSARMIVVPVVNPDGYVISRGLINEMKRKNCRVEPGIVPTWEECVATTGDLGVDPNRNYGAFWGGPGSSVETSAGNHHGARPYSEPEIANMRDLLNSHQVTVAVNAHTPDARLLRAPSSPLEPVPADVEAYDGLAQELGSLLGWVAGPWPEVYYDASGTAEEHGLYVNGTFGFTPELMPGFDGLQRFHPPYEYVPQQYWGTGEYEGSSARATFLRAWQAAADPALHSVVTGTAPAGIELTVRKDVTVESSPTPVADGGTLESDHELVSTLEVPRSGRFEWHLLPSLRQSQESSTLLEESWTISCRNPAGKPVRSVQVTVARGESADVDLSRCPRGPRG